MYKQAIQKLSAIAKKHNKTEFQQAVNQYSILQMIPEMDTLHYIKVLDHYKFLNIKDEKAWVIFEKSLISRELKQTELIQLTKLIFCFSQNSNNLIVWKTLEDLMILHLSNFQKQLFFHDLLKEDSNFGVCVYGFSKAKYHSNRLWRAIDNLILDSFPQISQKNLAMLFLSYESHPLRQSAVLNALESAALLRANEITKQNIIIIGFCMAKMENFSPVFWTRWEILVKPILLELNTKDLAQIIFAFGKVGQGTEELWQIFEKLVPKKIRYFSIIDYNNVLFAFLIHKRKSKVLWEELADYVRVKPMKEISIRRSSEDLVEILFISHVFSQKKSPNLDLWKKLGDLFAEFKKVPQAFKTPITKINYHTGILINNIHLWDQSLEKIYREIILTMEKDNTKTIKFYIDILYLSFSIGEPVSEEFFQFLLKQILDFDLKFARDSGSIGGIINMFCMYLRRYSDQNEKEYIAICKFLTSPYNLNFIMKGKGVLIMYKFFIQTNVDEKFWIEIFNYLDVKKNKIENVSNNIVNIIVAIFDSRKIGFDYKCNYLRFHQIILEKLDENDKNLLDRIKKIIFEKIEFIKAQEIFEYLGVNIDGFKVDVNYIEKNLEEYKLDEDDIVRD